MAYFVLMRYGHSISSHWLYLEMPPWNYAVCYIYKCSCRRCASGCVVVPDLQSGGCGFESQPGLLRTNVYSAFHPSGVGKWVPAAAGKAKAGIWLIPIADERVGVQVELWYPLRTRAIPERFCGGDSLRRGAISSVCTFTFYLVPFPI